MSGGRRLAMAIWAAGFALGPAAASGQSAEPQTNAPPPATDAVGPRDLQNFSLSGNVTKPAEEPASRPAAPASTTTDQASTGSPAVGTTAPPIHSVRRTRPAQSLAEQARPAVASANIVPPTQHDPVQDSSIDGVTSPVTSPVSSASPASLAPVPTATPLPDSHRLLLWPWFLALGVLAGGVAMLFWRNRQRHAFAGGLEFETYVAPEPAPKAPPAPTPPEPPRERIPPAPPAAPSRLDGGSGIVATRLRPWVELGIQPLRCIVEDHQIAVEFELELFNSGNAPARAVLVEASIFNAGPAQDEEIGAFIARPVGHGERLDAIPPLQRVTLRTQVVAPRASVQVFELAGRQLFVPLIAFNALYHWSGGEGQTSVSYLLGRDTKADKLAPFRLDLGPRVFRGLGARPLPLGERR